MYFKLDSVNLNVYLHYKLIQLYMHNAHIYISSSIQLIQMFIFITNIKKYNVKTSDTIACQNVLFTNNLKKY